MAEARWASASWHTLAWAVFGAGFVGAVAFVSLGCSMRRRATCCWCWRRARGSRRTSARRWARSGSCAGSGSTARGGWPGSRTTRPRLLEQRDVPVPERLVRRDPLRARLVRLSRHGAAGARGRVPGSQARHGGGDRGRERRGQDDAREALVPALPADRAVGSWWTDSTSRACPPRRGGRGSPARFRTSSVSSSGRGIPSESAILPRLDDEPAVVAAVDRAGADDVVARAAGRARDAARADLARRRGGQLRPVAEARPGPRLHARASAGPGAG